MQQVAPTVSPVGSVGASALCAEVSTCLLYTSVPRVNYGSESDDLSQARELFDALRKLDERGAKTVYARIPHTTGVGMAVYDGSAVVEGVTARLVPALADAETDTETYSGKMTHRRLILHQKSGIVQPSKLCLKPERSRFL